MLSAGSGAASVPARYLPALDLLRLAAATMVAVYHLSAGVPELWRPVRFGWVGVEIFFVLSGVLMASPMAHAQFGAFVKARLLRLYPAAWGCLLAGMMALALAMLAGATVGSPQPGAVLSSILLLKVWPGGFVASAYWTLPVELAFYALVALCLIAKIRPGANTLGKALIAWSAGYFLTLGATRLFGLDPARIDIEYGCNAVSLARHGGFFGLGLLIAGAGGNGWRPHCAAAAAVALGLGLVEIGWRARVLFTGEEAVAVGVQAALVWISATVWMALSMSSVAPRGLVRSPIAVQFLGRLTYPLYLLHQTVGAAVLPLARQHGLSAIASTGLALAVSFFAAAAVARYWEPWARSLAAEGLDRAAKASRLVGAKTFAVFARS